MSGSPTFDIDKWKKNRNGANLQLRHALRAGGIITLILPREEAYIEVSARNMILIYIEYIAEKFKFLCFCPESIDG